MPGILTKPKATACTSARLPLIELSQFTSKDFDRGASKLKEGLWILVKCVFFLNPLPLPSRLRCTLLRLFGAKVGKNVVIRSRANISFPWRLTIGNNTWIGEQVEILTLAPVTVGSNVCISQRAFLCTGSHDFRSASFDLITRPISIEDHSWIASSSFIAPGVTVERGAMVGAGVTVTTDVPAGSRLIPATPHIKLP